MNCSRRIVSSMAVYYTEAPSEWDCFFAFQPFNFLPFMTLNKDNSGGVEYVKNQIGFICFYWNDPARGNCRCRRTCYKIEPGCRKHHYVAGGVIYSIRCR